ncbi:MAG: hypothetical protein ACXWUG_08485 [Polyangiales bacterium]
MIGTLLLAASSFTGDTPSEPPNKPKQESEEVRIGALGSVGFPRPIGVEAMMKIAGVVAIGAEYSTLPATTISGVNVHLNAWAADLRVFPLRGPFFIGARLGRQHASTDATVTYLSHSYSGSATTDTTFVNPRLGLLWTMKPGFTIGMDAGLQIPISHTSSTTAPSGLTLPAGATTTTDYLGTKVLPTITLLQLGMLF